MKFMINEIHDKGIHDKWNLLQLLHLINLTFISALIFQVMVSYTFFCQYLIIILIFSFQDFTKILLLGASLLSILQSKKYYFIKYENCVLIYPCEYF